MTDQRRVPTGTSTSEATGSTLLDDLRAHDAPVAEYVAAGGFLGFSPEELFV